jgi:2'-5' RNA ligase
MRLFVAIPMPEFVRNHLAELQQPIDGVRWQEIEKTHLTLKFLGDTESERVPNLKSALTTIEMPSFSIRLSSLGYFPKGKQPRVLWVGVEKNKPLQLLHSEIEDKCTDLGFDPENRSFKPHITIARVKDAPKNKITSFIEEYQQFQMPEVWVDEFVLFESKLHPDGAKHSRLKTFPLRNQ